MAYLSPDFDYDVFVSYSHGDPRGTGESPLKTWSHALIKALIDDITTLSDEFDDLAVWYDRDLDPTLQLTPELRGKVKASAVLMILMSPRYLKSAWCGDERTWFQEQIEDRAAEEGRIFVVRAVPTDESTWPDFLRDERGQRGLQAEALLDDGNQNVDGNRDPYLRPHRVVRRAVIAGVKFQNGTEVVKMPAHHAA